MIAIGISGPCDNLLQNLRLGFLLELQFLDGFGSFGSERFDRPFRLSPVPRASSCRERVETAGAPSESLVENPDILLKLRFVERAVPVFDLSEAPVFLIECPEHKNPVIELIVKEHDKRIDD